MKKEIKRFEELLKDFIEAENPKTTYKIKFTLFEKLEEDFVKEFLAEGRKLQNQWKESLISVLSDPISPYNHKPRNPNRLFPHKVTGELVNSIKTKVNFRVFNNRKVFTFWFEILSYHAILTDEGYTKRGRRTTDGKWVDWMKDAFYRNPRGSVVSARALFEAFFNSKKLDRVINIELLKRGK